MHGVGDISRSVDLVAEYIDLRPFRDYPHLTFGALRAVHFASGLVTALTGLLFLVLAVFTPDVMAPTVYGEFAYSIPAEAWALAWANSGIVVMVATTKNGSWRQSPALKIAGHCSIASLFAIVGVSAITAPHGAHITAFSFITFVPAHGVLALAAWRECKARWHYAPK